MIKKLLHAMWSVCTFVQQRDLNANLVKTRAQPLSQCRSCFAAPLSNRVIAL